MHNNIERCHFVLWSCFLIIFVVVLKVYGAKVGGCGILRHDQLVVAVSEIFYCNFKKSTATKRKQRKMNSIKDKDDQKREKIRKLKLKKEETISNIKEQKNEEINKVNEKFSRMIKEVQNGGQEANQLVQKQEEYIGWRYRTIFGTVWYPDDPEDEFLGDSILLCCGCIPLIHEYFAKAMYLCSCGRHFVWKRYFTDRE
jgi:hypothetical protein